MIYVDTGKVDRVRSIADVRHDYAAVHREAAVSNRVCAEQGFAARISDPTVIIAVGQTCRFGGRMRAGPSIQVNRARRAVLVSVDDAPVADGGEVRSAYTGGGCGGPCQ